MFDGIRGLRIEEKVGRWKPVGSVIGNGILQVNGDFSTSSSFVKKRTTRIRGKVTAEKE
jgi:hypothetical protein